jgi:hypothetical protein
LLVRSSTRSSVAEAGRVEVGGGDLLLDVGEVEDPRGAVEGGQVEPVDRLAAVDEVGRSVDVGAGVGADAPAAHVGGIARGAGLDDLHLGAAAPVEHAGVDGNGHVDRLGEVQIHAALLLDADIMEVDPKMSGCRVEVALGRVGNCSTTAHPPTAPEKGLTDSDDAPD